MTAKANFLRKTCRRTALFLLAALIALPLQGLLYLRVSADTPPTWIDGAMPQLTLGDKLDTFPSDCYNTTWYYHSFTKANGSYDPIGRQAPTNVCAKQVGFGEYGSSGSPYIRPGTAIAFPAPSFMTPNPARPGLSIHP